MYGQEMDYHLKKSESMRMAEHCMEVKGSKKKGAARRPPLLKTWLLCRLLEQTQQVLRHLVCLCQHGDTRLNQDLLRGEGGHFGRNVKVKQG